MRALTVLQPWAWALAHGGKRVENRRWRTDYRGPLLIHAGKGRSELGAGMPVNRPDEALVFGAHLALANLVACLRYGSYRSLHGRDEWATGPFCWVLEDVRPLPKPIPERGRQGLWRPSAETVAELDRQFLGWSP